MQPTLLCRAATFEDTPTILLMAEDFWYTQEDYKEAFNKEHTAVSVLKALDQGLLFVAEYEEEVVGFIAAISGPILVNPDVLIAAELAWWVDPTYRMTGAGTLLIDSLEAECKDKGIKYLSMVYLDQSMPETVKTIYESKSYKRTESTYTKVLN